MTVEQLIEKLKEHDPKEEVLIEVNHDELVSVRNCKIEIKLVTQYNRITTSDCHMEEGDRVRRAAVIRL